MVTRISGEKISNQMMAMYDECINFLLQSKKKNNNLLDIKLLIFSTGTI